MMRRSKSAWPILLIAAGFSIWAVAFLLLYGTQAVGCRLGWDGVHLAASVSLQRVVQIVLYLASLAITFLLWQRLRVRITEDGTSARSFLVNVASQSSLAALGAVAFSFAGTLWLTAC